MTRDEFEAKHMGKHTNEALAELETRIETLEKFAGALLQSSALYGLLDGYLQRAGSLQKCFREFMRVAR